MGEKRRKADWPILMAAIALLIFVPLGIYVGGYFWLADSESGYWVPEKIPVVHRTYGAQWLAWIYEPAGKVEEILAGHEVEIGHEGLDSYP